MRPLWLALVLVIPVPLFGADPAIKFDPSEPLMDEVVVIRITGLPPGSLCTVRSRTLLAGKTCQATATFKANAQGIVDVSQQAPAKGSYTGVQPMGLFSAMEPQKDEVKATPLKLTDPRLTQFEVESADTIVAKAELKRWVLRSGVRVTAVKENGLVGTLFEPEGQERRPAVLVLSGSEGGVSENEAALLASRGYVAFALAYFRAEGLPQQLVDIPLEYLKKGLTWLAARDTVDGKRLGVTGGSKGGELALLLAAHTPELKAVVARVPSHVVWFGLGGTYRGSSWTFEGKPVPFLLPDGKLFAKVFAQRPIRYLEIYRSALEDEANAAKALIPVEKINGAVLLVSGTDDAMWPSSLMADKVMARLKEKKHPFPYKHLKYEGAGHGIPSAYVPMRLLIESGGLAMGGTAEANAKAQADSRPQILAFLKENLKGP